MVSNELWTLDNMQQITDAVQKGLQLIVRIELFSESFDFGVQLSINRRAPSDVIVTANTMMKFEI